MYEVKTELIVKYYTIMDMGKYIRTIISPYSALVKNISFERVNHPSEIYKLNFVEEKVLITIDWNVLRGITIGKTTGLDRTNERFKDIYDIYTELSKLKTFNGVEYVKLITYDVLEGQYYNSKLFKNAFTSHSNLFNKYGNDDIGLVLEGNRSPENIDYIVMFGPLDIEKDGKNHDLSLFDISAFENKKVEGCLVRSELTKNTSSFNSETLAKLFEFKFELINDITKQ